MSDNRYYVKCVRDSGPIRRKFHFRLKFLHAVAADLGAF
jgi:hypothetical protein